MSLDIVPADRDKWYMRIAMKWFIKKYSDGKNSDIIHEEMRDCGNPIFRFIIKQRKKLTDRILEAYQVRMIEQFSDFGLWIMYKDTAYRQIFVWFLKQILDNKEYLMPLVDKYYVDIDDMYVNLWSNTKKKTREMQESGELPVGILSEAEKYFVPSEQKRHMLEELERERKKKGLS